MSASVTALVAGSIAWLALGMLPMARPTTVSTHPSLPYALFMKLVRMNQPPAAPVPDNADNANPNPGVESRTVSMESGDTITGMLEDAGIPARDAAAVVVAMGKDFNPHQLKVGQNFDLTYSVATIDATGTPPKSKRSKTTIIMVNHKPVVVPVDLDEDSGPSTPEDSQAISRLLSLHFSPTIDQDITVTRGTDGSYAAQIEKKTLEIHRHRAGATIDSSLYLAAMQAGIPADVVVDMIHMFSYKVDFQRDLHPGDSFEVYYDYAYTPEGQPAKYGAISYAMLKLGGKQIIMYRYQPDPNEPPDYFDSNGQSAKGMLMKTPVDGARITSGFGQRFHPILGYTRMHKGIDFGVPIGTPVMSAGAGTIAFMGVQSGYGNFVIINHGNNYATAYGHLSRFATGTHKGTRVRQGQVFAYSGMSGMATGPHLHYEIRVNNGQVNPLSVKLAQGRMLSGSELRAFMAQRLKVDATIATLPLENKVQDVSTDLRQARTR